MKRARLLFFTLMCFFACISFVYAHPPSDIKITYDLDAKTVSAVILHNASNPQKHYIKKVDVSLNGKEIIEHTISFQETSESQKVSYYLPEMKMGDVISVEGYCSISGKLKKEIKIPLKNI